MKRRDSGTTWRRRAARGLKAGDSFTVERTLSRTETKAFGSLTRDYNPVHYDPRFAAAHGFPGVICHGLLAGALVCEFGGQVGWLASGMTFKFLRPTYPGDTLTCAVRITSLNARGKARAKVSIVNQRGERVVEAGLSGYLPGTRQKKVLSAMLAEGDPTNPLRGRTGVTRSRT